jgi:hypothetical protein
MALLTIATVSRAGVLVNLGNPAESGGDTFANTGKEFLYVNNTDNGTHQITIASTRSIEGLAVPGRTINIEGGNKRVIGPFPPSLHNDANGLATATFSEPSVMEIQAFRFQPEI